MTKINIAVGRSANAKFWKNESWDWVDLVNRLAQVQRTHESYREYMSMTKDEQSSIKDVGGFIGAYLSGGSRKIGAVVNKQLLTLDLDYAPLDFWNIFKIVYPNVTAVLHSTHKHSDENPRYRLVVPLDREITANEYEPVSRKFASYLNIDFFDPTTFETNRMMFWPSVSKDANYVYEYQPGEPLSADWMLSLYRNWTDISEWSFPTMANPLNKQHGAAKEQEDPTKKRGIVGLFCRAYDIDQAIAEFLPDIYVNKFEGRYTYAKGSTSGGAVVYDDRRWLYSHHSTDPCCGLLVNAWDMVRLHKFGHLDSDSAAQGSKAKSYKEMEQWAKQLKPVKLILAEETRESINKDFGLYQGLQTSQNPQISVHTPIANTKELLTVSNRPEWMASLEIDGQGNYVNSAQNISLILRLDEFLKDKFRFNSFDSRRYVLGPLPWRAGVDGLELAKDVDYSGVRNYIETFYGIAAPGKIDDSLALEFARNSYNPVTEYLDTLIWDGVERLDYLLQWCFGVENNQYTREALRKSLVAAVARAYKPGTKFDMVLTLVGAEGAKKSTFFKLLGRHWFSESFNTIQGKESFEQIQGKWIVEIAELSGMRKADVETIKHYITKTEDSFRPAYGRTVETYRRTCVFFATTNDWTFLKSTTGNRRFNPVDVNISNVKLDVFSPEFTGMIDQVWAEARFKYVLGESLYLSEEANRIANIERDLHLEGDDRTGMIDEYLDTLLPADWYDMTVDSRRQFFRLAPSQRPPGVMYRQTISANEVWVECFGKAEEDFSNRATREVSNALRCMRRLKYVNIQKTIKGYGRQRYYEIRREAT